MASIRIAFRTSSRGAPIARSTPISLVRRAGRAGISMIRVLIVDDEALVRTGLRMILQPAEDLDVVAEASDGSEAATVVAKHRPDVVLMDIRTPGMHGLAALEEIRRVADPPKVIMLTTFDLDSYVHRAWRAGASGFLGWTPRLLLVHTEV